MKYYGSSLPRQVLPNVAAASSGFDILITEVSMARGKSISQFCNHCDRITKMEVVGAVETQPDKIWYRCTRCRHASLIDQAELKRVLEESKKRVERSDCSEYRPENTYTIGQAIFHS